MQGAGTVNPGHLSRGKTGKSEQVALSHAESHRLLASWGAVEAFQIRIMYYPSSSAGYRDYEPPRDPETRQEREIRRVERDWHEIHRTGWVVLGLKRWQRDALVRHYRDGAPIGGRARRAALDAFGRRWVIWSEAVDGQINSL